MFWARVTSRRFARLLLSGSPSMWSTSTSVIRAPHSRSHYETMEQDAHRLARDPPHKTPEVQAWLAKRPRFHPHFTPTSASWLNLVERFFAEITAKRIRRGAFNSVAQLEGLAWSTRMAWGWRAILARERRALEKLRALHEDQVHIADDSRAWQKKPQEH